MEPGSHQAQPWIETREAKITKFINAFKAFLWLIFKEKISKKKLYFSLNSIFIVFMLLILIDHLDLKSDIIRNEEIFDAETDVI
jgi:hypothetical protein